MAGTRGQPRPVEGRLWQRSDLTRPYPGYEFRKTVTVGGFSRCSNQTNTIFGITSGLLNLRRCAVQNGQQILTCKGASHRSIPVDR
jgi:hypothetical protein